MKKLFLATVIAALATGIGCASTNPKGAYDDVKARVGTDLRWDRNTKEDEEARRAIDRLLAEELTADAAVRIALLSSPTVRAKLEELAIGQADLVQAGLLSNPTFGVGLTAWDREHIDPNLFMSVEQSFLDIVTLPLKKRVAASELEARKLEVAFHVIEIASETRNAYWHALAAEQTAAMRELVNEAAVASAELARRQAEAGNMSDLALTSELALSADQALEHRRAKTEAELARIELDRKMGTWGTRTNWRLPRRLPDPPASEPPLEHLEAKAIADRLDLAAARRSQQAMDSALTLAKTTRWFGKVDISVEAGRLRRSHHYAFGPALSIEIPLFDQRTAAIARLEAMVRQNEDELQALAIDIRADVRMARAKLVTARANVDDYIHTVIPLRENVVKFSQQQYDAMLLGVYQLLQSRQAEFTAYSESIAALRDYWVARSDLERTIGSRLSPR